MNVALLWKTARDSLPLLAVSIAAVVLFEMFFVLAMGEIATDLLEFVSRMQFIQQMIGVMLGFELSQDTSVNTLVVVGYAHPFLFIVTMGFLITTVTRVIVGEIDRGSADLLMSLPISRATIYITTSLVWMSAAGLLSASAWLGIWLGARFFPLPEPLNLARVAIGSVSLLVLLIAIGGTTALVSSVMNRRGNAVALIVAILLFSYVINFLAAFIRFFEGISFLGFLNYYRPVESVRDGTWPVPDLVILATIAVVTWTLGLAVFQRKDVPVR